MRDSKDQCSSELVIVASMHMHAYDGIMHKNRQLEEECATL